MNGSRINLPLLFLVLFAAAGLFAIGWHRIIIDTDIVSSLPQDDPVISDAVHIFARRFVTKQAPAYLKDGYLFLTVKRPGTKSGRGVSRPCFQKCGPGVPRQSISGMGIELRIKLESGTTSYSPVLQILDSTGTQTQCPGILMTGLTGPGLGLNRMRKSG